MNPKGKYEKPEITRIALKPEEATLTACKTAIMSGPGDGVRCGSPGHCNSDKTS